ncbi:MAG: hypothetical protein OEO20_13155 [Gemmatimonadota bacterium]|nr:hypothetical protein [Gemmatimonadota bacterium]MDH3367501.1 hypothetical protein [Gemmatimonadota bacterium]MDH3479242.1 hypothetical protein [Gemmatimonadota bacterium]MDH3568952.1 hypothetical protein [Gemmatimonadota bacterium]MDH5550384.1 hypothetical protein [Gemmatimonadota bacterium]
MRLRSALTWMAMCAGLGTVACGGEEAVVPGAPASEPPPPQTEMAATEAEVQSGTELLREVFTYTASGRDPFESLLRTGGVRPLLEDLRVTAINFDARYPGGSVAVLRDTTVGKRYTVRVGDELGRLRITAIRQDEVLVMIEEFGVERQSSLRLRRRQEGTQ